jgi:hypothetical protein
MTSRAVRLLNLGWGTPIVGALMKDVDHGNMAPIQGS